MSSDTVYLVEFDFDSDYLQRIYEKRYENITRFIRLTSLVRIHGVSTGIITAAHLTEAAEAVALPTPEDGPMSRFNLGHPRRVNARLARSHQPQL